MIRAIRVVDSDDIAHETVANDLVPRSLPSFATSVISASGITVDRTGNGELTHLKCVVDSPLIALSESLYDSKNGEDALTVALRINSSTICNARIAADTESKQMTLLLVSNVSVHWILWRFPFRDGERLLSSFPVGDAAVFLPHRSFLFGSLISNASITASSACLLPAADSMVFFAIAFDNARVLFVRAPALAGTDSPNFEHSFIEPTSLLSRLISLASSSQQSQSVVSIDSFGDFALGVAAAFILRSSHSLELYNITSKKRLSACISSPAVYTCPGAPLLAKLVEVGDTRCIAVLHRPPKHHENMLEMTLCKISFLPKLALSPTSTIDLSPCLSNVSVVDFGLLSNCVFLACQTNDGVPLCFFVPSRLDGDSAVVTGKPSAVQYWRRPLTTYSGDDEMMYNETEQLTHNVLSADCGSVQLLRQLLQALRLPHMGMISSHVVSSGISAALSARQALAAELNSTGINDQSSRMAIESLSRKIENIWSKDRKVLGVHMCFSKNMALIYHRHSVAVIIPTAPVIPIEPMFAVSDHVDLLEKVASAFYNNILSSSEGAGVALFSSKEAVMECATSFLLTLDEATRYAVETLPRGKLDSAVRALLRPSLESSPKAVAYETKSLSEIASSKFLHRLLSRMILTNFDWLLSYSLALIVLDQEGNSDVSALATFAMVVKSVRTLLESPLTADDSSSDAATPSSSSSLSWVIDSFVEYALTDSTILASYLSSRNQQPSVTLVGSILTKLLLPQNSSFILEQFLLDSSLFSEFESLQKCIGSVNNYPCGRYRLYLYGLSALLRNHPGMALEYFTDASMNIDEMDAALLLERCRPHISRINPLAADFWIRILDLAQQFGCVEIAIEAAERAKPYFMGNLSSGSTDSSYSRVLDMKLFKLQCQSQNFRGAIATLLTMNEDEDQTAAVNVIVSTAINESKLLDLVDCLLIEMSTYSNDKVNTLVATALQRAMRSSEYPDWDVSWSLYRMNLSQSYLREAASALFEYYARLPSLATLTPRDFSRRRDALALAFCTLKMLTPQSDQWLATRTFKGHGGESDDGADHIICLANIDELCRIEDARVELINACELPLDVQMDGVDCEKAKRLRESAENTRRPKFEEAAPIILRLGASDLVRWLSIAQLFGAATELCRSLQLPSRDVSAPLIDSLCSKLDSNYNLIYESDMKACLLRLDDPRPTFHAVHALYSGDLELPSWLWRLASRQDSDALLRATIRYKRLLDAGRITVAILENALTTEPSLGAAAFSCYLPWKHLDHVVAALSEFTKTTPAKSVDGASEITDVHARVQGLCARYAKHAENIKRQRIVGAF